eukprot:6435176-Lingulodinium_polyedra.AAC.1
MLMCGRLSLSRKVACRAWAMRAGRQSAKDCSTTAFSCEALRSMPARDIAWTKAMQENARRLLRPACLSSI